VLVYAECMGAVLSAEPVTLSTRMKSLLRRGLLNIEYRVSSVKFRVSSLSGRLIVVRLNFLPVCFKKS
jgi:hypothetical protein